jgi:armadillo repeat-containing protein 1
LTQNLCEAVAKTHTMTAQQVVRDDSGQEVMLSFGQSPSKFHKVQLLVSPAAR